MKPLGICGRHSVKCGAFNGSVEGLMEMDSSRFLGAGSGRAEEDALEEDECA